ncbi:MAG: hypothetical protein KGZ25_11990, partial [Planctomycetes bacterium]|nr:hypothetical protein [Planctomycetota bacterium]
MNQLKTAFLVFSIIFFVGCGRENTPPLQKTENAPKPGAKPVSEAPKKTAKTVHVFVALCDNENQGIVRVPDKLGNGEDPENNLYWGARYGVKTFLKTSASWKLLATRKNTGENILESLLFIQRRQNIYLVADA